MAKSLGRESMKFLMHVCNYCAITLNHRAFGVSKAGSNCNTLEDLQLEPGKGLPTSNCILMIFLILQLFESTFLSFPALNGTRSHSRPGFNLLATSESVWYVKSLKEAVTPCLFSSHWVALIILTMAEMAQTRYLRKRLWYRTQHGSPENINKTFFKDSASDRWLLFCWCTLLNQQKRSNLSVLVLSGLF